MRADDSPKIPVPGAAGAAIFIALKGLAMKSGPGGVTIKKERVAGGGYVYVIGHHEQPDNPVLGAHHGN